MTVLTIRSHKRFAVRQGVRLRDQATSPADGMLIEVSIGGCRISSVDSDAYQLGQPLSVHVDGFGDIPSEVRWSGEGVLGLRFSPPLHIDCLDRLIRTCRREIEAAIAIPRRASA